MHCALFQQYRLYALHFSKRAGAGLEKLPLAKGQAEGALAEPLLLARVGHPALFEALGAALGPLPSPARIAEQKHGGLRGSRAEGLGHGFAGGQQR